MGSSLLKGGGSIKEKFDVVGITSIGDMITQQF
jgi:hypothetical protein